MRRRTDAVALLSRFQQAAGKLREGRRMQAVRPAQGQRPQRRIHLPQQFGGAGIQPALGAAQGLRQPCERLPLGGHRRTFAQLLQSLRDLAQHGYRLAPAFALDEV